MYNYTPTATLPAPAALDINVARTLANIARRAETLWQDGYTVKPTAQAGAFYVTTPPASGDVNGDTLRTYKVWACDFKQSCTCLAFLQYGECKHHLAVSEMVAEGEAADAEWERMEECMNFFNGRYDR